MLITVADPGEPPPPLFLDQTEARRAEKIVSETAPPLFSKGLNDPPPPPPYLKVWIRHWIKIRFSLTVFLFIKLH